jgi:cyclic-di-GMP phosphodiesterase, flagellum assembly factor TipF
MGPQSILYLGGALGGAVAAGAAFVSSGAPAAAAAGAALLGGVSVTACIAVLKAERGRRASDARFDTLAEEVVLLRQRQADFETKLGSIHHQSVESPALVWRAATADIQVLGSLVSDLAKTVAEHDAVLSAEDADAPVEAAVSRATAQGGIQGGVGVTAGSSFMLPQTSPPPASWFEDEADPGFTADPQPAPAFAHASAQPAQRATVSPAMLAELKSTLAAALTSDRLELCLQPFVTLPQRKVAGYEAVLRLKGENNELQDAQELRAAAKLAGMDRDLDRILIERTGQVLRVLRARERVVSITCPISGESLMDAPFRSAVEAVARSEGKLAQNIMLSAPLDDMPKLQAGGDDPLAALRRTGVVLGVRARSSGGIDAASLEKAGVTEVRMDASVLVGASDRDAAGDIHPADVSELLERRGIRLLVTGVDSEDVVRDLLDLSAALAQGGLFGASRPVRPEVLQPRAVREPSVAPRPSRAAKPAEPPQGAKRQSFRSLLRRA